MGLLNEVALNLYLCALIATRNEWDQLTNLFVRMFVKEGREGRVFRRESRMRKKHFRSVQRYGQRVKAFTQKLTVEIVPSVQTGLKNPEK